ncbi:MAG: AMP-binding protein [Gammaproteobacteria bacterium]|nr:AMP-binding protein [Gammaproteobacteria bacterium]
MLRLNTLANLHQHNAEKIPEKTAIVFRGENVSYSQHFHRAVRLANALSDQGCQVGDRVAVLAKNCLNYLEVYTACELAGYIIVPINFRLAIAEIHYVLENTEPLVCFYSDEQRAILSTLFTDSSSDRKYIAFDGQGSAYESFLQSGKDTAPDYSPAADDPACIVHTSGTTGKPKGAILTQGGLFGIAHTIGEDAEIGSDDYGLVMQPLFHVGAKFLQLAHHVKGASINLQTNFEPEMVWRVLSEEKVTTMQLVPTMLAMVLDHVKDEAYPQTRLKLFFILQRQYANLCYGEVLMFLVRSFFSNTDRLRLGR